jgi:hypothetical protein
MLTVVTWEAQTHVNTNTWFTMWRFVPVSYKDLLTLYLYFVIKVSWKINTVLKNHFAAWSTFSTKIRFEASLCLRNPKIIYKWHKTKYVDMFNLFWSSFEGRVYKWNVYPRSVCSYWLFVYYCLATLCIERMSYVCVKLYWPQYYVSLTYRYVLGAYQITRLPHSHPSAYNIHPMW